MVMYFVSALWVLETGEEMCTLTVGFRTYSAFWNKNPNKTNQPKPQKQIPKQAFPPKNTQQTPTVLEMQTVKMFTHNLPFEAVFYALDTEQGPTMSVGS